MTAPLIPPDSFARFTDYLLALPADNLSAAMEIEQKSRKITKDEVWMSYATDFWQKACKHPQTNEIHREDASKILGCLNQLTDDAVVSEFRGMRRYLNGRTDTFAAGMARLLEILVFRRRLMSAVNEAN